MPLSNFIYLLLLFFFLIPCAAQQSVRFLFYNTENFFDCYDDTLTDDNEFLPDGIRHWTYGRFQQKLNHLYKVIVAAGNCESPAMIGLCEVENRWVLNQLVYETPINKYEYKFIHRDSQDPRGIDVAFIYKPEIFYPVSVKWLNVKGLKSGDEPTRDILYIKGTVWEKDTLHIFLNHWPSRWFGQLETEHKRIASARILRKSVDSLFLSSPRVSIMLVGDYNDEPADQSILNILQAKNNWSQSQDTCLYNLTVYVSDKQEGTIKYRGIWYSFDQIIVSGSLLRKENMFISHEGMRIFNPGFLLKEDESYPGRKPYRTYEGIKYLGGFSDHLPVYVDIVKED